MEIILDGQLDESAWFESQNTGDFWQYFPTDSVHAQGGTEIYMTYDDNNLYVAVKCKTIANDFVVPSLKRDYGFRSNDNISILFDTYNDATNAFLFGMNPAGVRREALISNGGRRGRDFASSWDNKWAGTSKSYKNYWIGEFSIPFKTLRYQEGATEWRFNSYRNDTQINELSTWNNIPRNQIIMDLSYMGKIIWDEPLKKQNANFTVIPYTSTALSRDYEDDPNGNIQSDLNIGGDAKIGITSGLNLDLTVNPDFSQVEVDRQVTNLDRFEIFFPERRQFFLENADLFGGFGGGRLNPFFSRRIGVAQDTATGQNIQNTILYGARLSGKVNNRLRVGLLNMQTAKQTANDLPAYNYTNAAIEKTVFARSQIAAFFVNKQAVGNDDLGADLNSYNRTTGLEYRLASADNVWAGKIGVQKTFTPDITTNDFAQYIRLGYTKRLFNIGFDQYFIENNFTPEVGFVPRKDMLYLSPEASINIFPSNKTINRHRIGFDVLLYYKLGQDDSEVIKDFGSWEREFVGFHEMRFQSSANLEYRLSNTNVTLLNDFDPTRIQDDDVYLPAGSTYNYTNLNIRFRSDSRQRFSYRLGANAGQFYNGYRLSTNGELTYRFQPYGSVGLEYRLNYIDLEAPFKPATLWLVGPRVDLTFTKSLFLSTFIQYNSQLDNLNINARFQWRYAPVSDFFIVYTDNYLTNPWDEFGSRNRALVAKLTYWLNL